MAPVPRGSRQDARPGQADGRGPIVMLSFTPKQIRSEPAEVIETIRGTLEGARGRPPLNLRTVPASEAGRLAKPSRPAKLVSQSRGLRSEWGRCRWWR